MIEKDDEKEKSVIISKLIIVSRSVIQLRTYRVKMTKKKTRREKHEMFKEREN